MLFSPVFFANKNKSPRTSVCRTFGGRSFDLRSHSAFCTIFHPLNKSKILYSLYSLNARSRRGILGRSVGKTTQRSKTPFVCCSSFPFLALCCQPHFTLHRRSLSPTGSSLMTSAALLLLIRIYDYEIFIRSGRYTSRMLSDISSPISPSARRISI